MTDYWIGALAIMLFGFVGFFLFEKNKITEKFFGDKQNSIYISIVFFIFGIYLSHEGMMGQMSFSGQIGYALGVYSTVLIGAALTTFIGMGFKFSLDNKKFFYSLNSIIILITILISIG